MGFISIILTVLFDQNTKRIRLREFVGVLFLGPFGLLMLAIIFFEQKMGDIVIWKRK